MTQTSISSYNAAPFTCLSDDATAPVMMERPPIRVPRSAARSYTDGELQAAAAMMNKLRCREDQKVLAYSPVVDETDHAVDVAVDRLLRLL